MAKNRAQTTEEEEAILQRERQREELILRQHVRDTGSDEVLEIDGTKPYTDAMRRLRQFRDQWRLHDRRRDDNNRVDQEIERNKPGFFGGLLLMIPDVMLPSREGWYGRMWG